MNISVEEGGGVKLEVTLIWASSRFLFFYCCSTGVHCDISKSSYNISWLNSPSPSFSFISPPEISIFYIILRNFLWGCC
jgi:hypothetical protein